MGMTMTQKILANKAGLSEVHAGQFIEANIDLCLATTSLLLLLSKSLDAQESRMFLIV